MDQSNHRSKRKANWYLESVSDAPNKWVVPINASPFTIGRTDDCDLTLRSKWISRHHAQIHLSGSLLWIRDLDSTNGTFLNQKKITEAELLEVDDILNFAGSKFRVTSRQMVRSALADETFSFDSVEDQAQVNPYERPLLKLISERNVIPHFQPILNLSTLHVIGYEILGRIAGYDLPSNPAELFSIADMLGHSAELSAIFREEGVQVGKKLNGYPQLFVNTTPTEIYQMDTLIQSLERICEIAPSNRIVVEVSEKAVTNTWAMERFRAKLADLNLGLAYDDFGVGQSRLVELAKVPPDFLKFDMSMIRNIHIAPKRLHQMVLTFVNVARDLGIATLAEGVECREESETCQQIGFEYVQGYLYGRPVPITELDLSEATFVIR